MHTKYQMNLTKFD